MIPLEVNKAFLNNCSKGVNKYYKNLEPYLECIEANTGMSTISKGYLTFNSKHRFLWSPGQVGSLISPHHIITCHDMIDHKFYNGLLKNKVKFHLHKLAYKNASMVIFISNATMHDFIEVYNFLPKKYCVIPSGFNTLHFRNQEKINKNMDCILVTNSLPHKNNELFIQAFAHELIRKSNLRPVIVGDLTDEFKNYTLELGLKVEFLYNIPETELQSRLKKARCLVSPSLIEGHNLPVSEAISLGTKTIISDIPVHREFYDSYSDFFDPLDSISLVKKLNEVSQTCYKLFPIVDWKNLRTWKDVANDYIAVLSDLTGTEDDK